MEAHFFNASAPDRQTQYKYNDYVIYFKHSVFTHVLIIVHFLDPHLRSKMTNREHFHLRWNDFDNIVTSAFGTPKSDGDLTDVTLNEQTPQDCYKICYVWNTALDSVQG